MRRYLRSIAYPVSVLRSPPDWQGCQGEECARLLNQRCAGPQKACCLVVASKKRTRSCASACGCTTTPPKKTAYQDGFCNKCDLDESLTLSTAEIIERPSFESTPAQRRSIASRSPKSKSRPRLTTRSFTSLGDARQKPSYQSLLEEVSRKAASAPSPRRCTARTSASKR